MYSSSPKNIIILQIFWVLIVVKDEGVDFRDISKYRPITKSYQLTAMSVKIEAILRSLSWFYLFFYPNNTMTNSLILLWSLHSYPVTGNSCWWDIDISKKKKIVTAKKMSRIWSNPVKFIEIELIINLVFFFYYYSFNNELKYLNMTYNMYLNMIHISYDT